MLSLLSRTLLTTALLLPSAFASCKVNPALKRSAFVPQQVLSGQAASVPQFVLDYAPLVWLFSTDPYFPADIGAQLTNTHPTLNMTSITDGPSPLTLDNLDQLNSLGGTNVYLTSNGDFTKLPAWLDGVAPDSTGKTQGARTCAVIVNEKANGIVDAFYMYFYAYNQGNKLLSFEELGDHVGDWEHNMIRFLNGTPTAAWFSEHQNGEAFTYTALNKTGDRILNFVANGTHSNWPDAGEHDHTIPDVSLPEGPLIDHTDTGHLWDPLLSAYYYSVSFPDSNGPDDSSNATFTALADPYGNALFANTSSTPLNWLYFQGQWGDEQLADTDPRQAKFLDVAYKYTSGPNGPMFKNLQRSKVCPDNGILCVIREEITPGS